MVNETKIERDQEGGYVPEWMPRRIEIQHTLGGPSDEGAERADDHKKTTPAWFCDPAV